MNHFVLQHNSYATPEDVSFDQKGTFFCPKPIPTRQLGWKFCQENEGYDSNVGTELLDIIQNKKVSSSPPYFLGSPPVRASNPLVQDEQFKWEERIPQSTPVVSSSPGLSSSSASSGLSSPSSPFRKGGCVRMKFGVRSAKVRVVGFDCHVPAVAYWSWFKGSVHRRQMQSKGEAVDQQEMTNSS